MWIRQRNYPVVTLYEYIYNAIAYEINLANVYSNKIQAIRKKISRKQQKIYINVNLCLVAMSLTYLQLS